MDLLNLDLESASAPHDRLVEQEGFEVLHILPRLTNSLDTQPGHTAPSCIEVAITAAKLSEWRDYFVPCGQAGLRGLATDCRDEELARLKALVGDLAMRLTPSRAAVRRLKAGAR